MRKHYLYPSEEVSKQWIITNNKTPEQNIIRSFPDFYDAEKKEFYEVKCLFPGPGTPSINLSVGQFFEFQIINPTMLVFANTKDPQPTYVIKYNELRTMPNPPFRLCVQDKYHNKSDPINKIKTQNYCWILKKRGRPPKVKKNTK